MKKTFDPSFALSFALGGLFATMVILAVFGIRGVGRVGESGGKACSRPPSGEPSLADVVQVDYD